MPTPIDLVVLQRITALLEQMPDVVSLVGDPVNMVGRVFRGRSVFGEETPLPMLSILEATDVADGPYADDARTLQHTEWGLVIQGFVEHDVENPLDAAYYLKASTQAMLSRVTAMTSRPGRAPAPAFPESYLLGERAAGESLISLMEVGRGVVRPPDARISTTTFFYLPVRVVLATDASQPYLGP